MRAAIETGSPLAAVCVDDAMGAGPAAIRDLLNIAMATPETARVPVAILSSDWKTLEAGMQCVQGKPLIGPLSLADGDEEFVRRVSLAARYGAAVLVALADEEGDARSYRRKTSVAARMPAAGSGNSIRNGNCAAGSWLYLTGIVPILACAGL